MKDLVEKDKFQPRKDFAFLMSKPGLFFNIMPESEKKIHISALSSNHFLDVADEASGASKDIAQMQALFGDKESDKRVIEILHEAPELPPLSSGRPPSFYDFLETIVKRHA